VSQRVHFAHFHDWGDNPVVLKTLDNPQHVCWKTKDGEQRCFTVALCGHRYEGAWFNRVVVDGVPKHVAPSKTRNKHGQQWKLVTPLVYRPIRMTSLPLQVTCRRCAGHLQNLGFEIAVVPCPAYTERLFREISR
jgi:hypothetical protein